MLSLLPLLLAGACTQEQVASDPSEVGIDLPATYGPDEVALGVDRLLTYPMPLEFDLTEVPAITIYGDGRVVTGDRNVNIMREGPALPEMHIRMISEQAVRDLVQLALAAGAGDGTYLGQTAIYDLLDTVFTVLTADGERRTEVYGLGDESGSLSQEQIQARRRLEELYAKLVDLPTTLGTDQVGAETGYEPVALAVFTRPWSDPHSVIPPLPELTWPGPALVGEPRGEGTEALTCVDVTGADVRSVLDAAGTAEWLTPWVVDGERHHIWFRPLLPHETSCADL
jgi:hypothetical protein